MDLTNLLKRDLDDVVFEHRNKAYGAYVLRKNYSENVKKASLVGVSAFLLLISSPLIADRMKPKNDALNMAVVEMKELNNKKDDVKPPKPTPPPPPKQEIKKIATIRVVPPRVLEDEQVKKEEPILPNVPDAAISTKTQDGEKADNLSPMIDPTPPSVPAPPDEPEVKKPAEDQPLLIVEEKPEFPDGDKAMMKFLYENIKYPTIARENNIEGTVFISFVVGNDGTIKNVEVKRGIGGGCNEEALRVVKMMPRWKPGRQQGRAVPVIFNLPVKFKLE